MLWAASSSLSSQSDTVNIIARLWKIARAKGLRRAEEFAEICDRQDEEGNLLHKRLPNLLIIGYIIRVLEERLT